MIQCMTLPLSLSKKLNKKDGFPNNYYAKENSINFRSNQSRYLIHADGASTNTSESHRWAIHSNPPGKDFYDWQNRCASTNHVHNPYKVLKITIFPSTSPTSLFRIEAKNKQTNSSKFKIFQFSCSLINFCTNRWHSIRTIHLVHVRVSIRTVVVWEI